MKFRILILLLLFLPFANAADFSVGVSPNIVFLGDVSPGDQKIVKFGIFSVSTDPLLVYLSSQNGDFDFFAKGYKEYMPAFSEQQTTSWIEFLSNPVEINPEERKVGRGWTDINLLLNVPKDAEPGFHVVYITPYPTVYGQVNAPVGTTIVSVVRVSIIFYVKGDAKRDGIILDTTAAGYSEHGFTAKTFFQNTGSETIQAYAKNKVYDQNGSLIGEFESSKSYVKPEETFMFETPVYAQLPEGEYSVDSKVLFTTGDATKTGMVTLFVPAATEQQVQPKTGLPWTTVLIIIVLIVIIVWWLRAKRR